MRRSHVAAFTACILLGAIALTMPAYAGPTAVGGGAPTALEVYVGEITPDQLGVLRSLGLDHEDFATGPGRTKGTIAVEAVLTGKEAHRLEIKGVKLAVKKVRGKNTSELLRAQSAAGWNVFRPYSGSGGLEEELRATTASNPLLTKLVTIGHTVQGKPILAVKVGFGAKFLPDGLHPSVLYVGAQHAREWITPEMNRRLMHHMLDSFGKDRDITRLLLTRELWFVPVANPDGYDFTFTGDNRLWRKNLRDNDGNGVIEPGDGVDPNRNYPTAWGYDDEGSSPESASETYRGKSAGSEPETKAIDGLARRVKFEYMINYHSAAELLLYGVGTQTTTASPDDVIFEALLGDDTNPAVPGYDPDVSAELYTTNGETTDHLSSAYGTLAFTPEMSTCQTVSALDPNDPWVPEDCASGFNFPDDEKLIAAEYAKNVPLALAVADSAGHPDEPTSVIGRTTADIVADAFEVSHGKTQPVAANVRKSLKDVRMHYSINGGRERTVKVTEWKGGDRYGEMYRRYYTEMRGTVTGARAGDHVEVWFTGRKKSSNVSSGKFTYTVASDIGGRVLVLAAEDVTGISPAQGVTSAKYADDYQTALTAAGYSSDVYDFDVNGRKAPHHLGVLSHYDAVVWETGDDIIPRSVGQVPGTAAKAALDLELSARDYVNEGGKLLVTGQYSLFAHAGNGAYTYNPFAPPECTTSGQYPCIGLSDDFLQYWLGAYNYVDGAGSDPDGEPHPLGGGNGQFAGFTGTLNAPGSAENQGHTASFLTTSSFLPPAQFPQFGGSSAVDWLRPGAAPFDPHTGSWYVYSGRSDVSYKRVTRTVDLTGVGTAGLKFWASYDTEEDWDYMFVEAHEVGTDNWTTLPDANGHTANETGDSCAGDWVNRLHPHLAHYQAPDCAPHGTTGDWNAATGASGGWTQWSVDLSAYAGRQVELSISYASDWSTQGLGVFLDDVQLTVGATTTETSFEDGLGGWTIAGAPSGSQPNGAVDFARSQQAFDEGAVVITDNTVFTGFGLEGLTPATRADFLKRAMRHLLGS